MSAKKQAILTTATRLFNQYGYNNVGIDRIISESQVAKMTFYKYFPSKDNLIRECLIERDHFIRNSIELSIAKASKKTSRLDILFDWYEDWFKSHDFYGCMFIKAMDEFGSNEQLNYIVKQHKYWLASYIKNALQDYDMGDKDSMSLQIMLLLDGAIVNENTYHDGKAIKVARQLTQQVLK